jgi:epoxyqueuosine reductase
VTASESIKARALALGFDAAGIARAEPLDAQARYEAWLAAGRHGEMDYLASDEHRERRADPAKILRGIRSVVCVALCYPPERDEARDRRLGRIARYAVGDDYHRVMKDKLLALQREIAALLPGSRPLWYSDTGAILERGWAERAGLGWIGKHSGLLSEERGSYFLLGEILLDRELEPDAPPPRERCGTCTRCIGACPTGAIVAPYQVDARLCISYLTIEHRGPIPIDLRPAIADWVFGCDLCQDTCPWNRFAPPAREARLHARELAGHSLEEFLALDEAGFRETFAHSPIRRAQRSGFLRNVCVALGNRGEASAIPALLRALSDDAEPLVRGHAAWALGEIAARRPGDRGAAEGDPVAAALRRAAAGDPDATVRDEAAAALAGPPQDRRGAPSTQPSPPSA